MDEEVGSWVRFDWCDLAELRLMSYGEGRGNASGVDLDHAGG